MSIIAPSNIYYLLAYASRIRPDEALTKGTEAFENHLNVLAAILSRCMDSVIRRGMVRGYTQHSEITSYPHGRIDIRGSIRSGAIPQNRLACDFELFDHRTYENKVIRSTMEMLLSKPRLSHEIVEALGTTCRRMEDPGHIEFDAIDWRKVAYAGHDRDYITALNACRLIADCVIPSEDEGGRVMAGFISEEKEYALYEEFVRGYFDVEHRGIYDSRHQLKWHTGGVQSPFLPVMEMDVLLRSKKKTLIIDTKCYKTVLKKNLGIWRYHSPNIYQIKAYVGNWRYEHESDDTEGMLLYAYPGGQSIDESVSLDGAMIHFKTLNLNGDWDSIKEQLDGIAGMLRGMKDGQELCKNLRMA